MNGFISINKPAGPSSHTVTNKIRNILKIKKAGHAGTLDPLASGLLVCAAGNATRLIQYLRLEPKVYRFQIDFSKSTDTLDYEGNTVSIGNSIPSQNEIKQTLLKFTGTITQTPPIFSAVKINGTPAYKLARKGEKFRLKERSVKIDYFKMLNYGRESLKADFILSCSSGTYIRSIIRDLCSATHCCGCASLIYRETAGRFNVEDSVPFQSIKTVDDIKITPIYDIFYDYGSVITASGEQLKSLSYGKSINVEKTGVKNCPVFIFNSSNDIAAVGKIIIPGVFKPEKVFSV